MEQPFLSVILPVYNVDKYLVHCLDSIKSQTFLSYELIVVNDCSPDNSGMIIKSFIDQNPQIDIKLINHKQNRGLSAARNSGLDIAKGKYVYFLDSDDDILPNCFETLCNQASSSKADIIVGENYIVSEGETKRVELQVNGFLSQNNILDAYCKRKWYNQVWNKLYRMDFLKEKKLRFVEGTILEDEIWSFDIACLAQTAIFIKDPTYNYYIRPKSIISTVKDSSARWKTFLNVNRIIREHISCYHLEANASVGLYFLENLLVTVSGLKAQKALTPALLDNAVQLNAMPILQLYKRNKLSLKQLIAYSYFMLPKPLSFWWHRVLSSI